MSDIKAILDILFTAIFEILIIFFAYILFKLFLIHMKNRSKGSLKRRFKHFLYHVKVSKLPLYLDFIKLIILDTIQGKRKFKLFGIWTFCGYFGEGKTLGAVMYALKLKLKHPWLKIYTNFKLAGQDGIITCWQDILSVPKGSIIIFDEIQSTFMSNKFADFPIELLWHLTQCRKNGLAVFCSTPVFKRMDIKLREATNFVVACKNVWNMDRLFKYSFYNGDKYESYQDSKVKLAMHTLFTEKFIADDFIRRKYDTKEIVKRFEVVEEKKVNRLTKNDIQYQIDEAIRKFAKKNKLAA
ncbi:MAG: hypothetical protein N2645_06900 [Clostridia bacterium]|nr:hypothetical protein [Clostridia bacterium]